MKMFWTTVEKNSTIESYAAPPKYYNVKVRFTNDSPYRFLDLVVSIDILDGGELEICREDDLNIVFAKGTWNSYEIVP